MKPRIILSLSLLISLIFIISTASAIAQQIDQNLQAPHRENTTILSVLNQNDLEPFTTLAPDWGGFWQDVPDAPFAFSRFDGGYTFQNNRIYFLGGRLSDGSTDGSVWYLTPDGDYYDTGVDLVTPVSNYTMNLVEDTIDWGFYIFCGNQGGIQSKSVQIYYPSTMTAIQLGPEDNYPGSGSCTSALNVVYNNKVYIAGGFNPGIAPYNWGETWVFDPMADPGSRWTQITSANLNLPRAYIMGTVIDDKIYAIGGDWYDPTSTVCGASLCSEPIVEVLDLSEPVLFWNDAAVSDLPEGCSQGRAYGFDTISQYADPDGTPLAGRIVTTCSTFAEESERVYVYTSRADKWEIFPSLNHARRNQAAEFIPISQLNLGLLYNWGGIYDGDSNVLTTPERYTVTTNGCTVLLVDDDMDFDEVVGPNSGGRIYYIDALSYLGYHYTFWDTVSQGIPPASTLSNYDIVVWFTGYDYLTPISPEEETEIMSYLDTGGNLFMSSQDQEWAYPGSVILSDYFGVESVIPDVTLRSVAGSPSDSLYAGLGSYDFHRPDDYLPYWPTGNSEGPWDDAFIPKSDAFASLIYPTSGQTSAVRYDSGTFKTIYLGFPLEWVNSIQERAQILGTGLKWMCPIIEPIYLPLVQK